MRERTGYGRCNSQRARARAGRMHMQIIAVGVTNRRDQQKSTIYSFRGPFWTALTPVRAFSFDFRHRNYN